LSVFGVRPEKEKELLDRMRALGIGPGDLEEKFVRSGGPGGQNLNKTATCVYLRHISTGLEVKMQESRSQGLNRFLARRALTEKIESRILGRDTGRVKRAEKIRRQKSRRARKSRKKYGS